MIVIAFRVVIKILGDPELTPVFIHKAIYTGGFQRWIFDMRIHGVAPDRIVMVLWIQLIDSRRSMPADTNDSNAENVPLAAGPRDALITGAAGAANKSWTACCENRIVQK